MESKQETFRKTTPKEENYEKQEKDQSSEWLAQHGFWYPRE